MKPLENIFSSKKPIKSQIPKCPNPNVPIIIDTREKQSFIATNLVEQKANLKFEKLEVGDYEIQDVVIERKEYSDFISSMIDKRLSSQLSNLKKYPNPLLILEKDSSKKSYSRLNENAIKGMILSIATDYKIPIIYSSSQEETATLLILLSKRKEKNPIKTSKRISKTNLSFQEQKQFLLEGFPGIGPTISRSLLEKFKTLKNIFSLSKDDLLSINNFHEKKVDEFKKILEK